MTTSGQERVNHATPWGPAIMGNLDECGDVVVKRRILFRGSRSYWCACSCAEKSRQARLDMEGQAVNLSLSNIFAGEANRICLIPESGDLRGTLFVDVSIKHPVVILGMSNCRIVVHRSELHTSLEMKRRNQEYYSYFAQRKEEKICPKNHNSAPGSTTNKPDHLHTMQCRHVYIPKQYFPVKPCNALKQVHSLNAKCAGYTVSFPIKVLK